MHDNNSIKAKREKCKCMAVSFFTVCVMINDIRLVCDRFQRHVVTPDQPLQRIKQRGIANKPIEKIKGNKKYLRGTSTKDRWDIENY